jgi:hypothetical protein
MSLEEFKIIQISQVELAARNFLSLFSMNLTYDVANGFRTLRENNSYLRGVSLREFTEEMLFPGSFREGISVNDLVL